MWILTENDNLVNADVLSSIHTFNSPNVIEADHDGGGSFVLLTIPVGEDIELIKQRFHHIFDMTLRSGGVLYPQSALAPQSPTPLLMG